MGDNGNPFDQPLNSELQEHQQQAAVTQQASPNGNPFEEPLASEKAEAAHADALQKSRPKSYLQQALHPEGDIQNPMQPGESFALAHPEEQGTLAGAALIGAGGAALPAAAPLLTAIGGHLKTIKTIIDTAQSLGMGALGYKEARELFKEFTKDDKGK